MHWKRNNFNKYETYFHYTIPHRYLECLQFEKLKIPMRTCSMISPLASESSSICALSMFASSMSSFAVWLLFSPFLALFCKYNSSVNASKTLLFYKIFLTALQTSSRALGNSYCVLVPIYFQHLNSHSTLKDIRSFWWEKTTVLNTNWFNNTNFNKPFHLLFFFLELFPLQKNPFFFF